MVNLVIILHGAERKSSEADERVSTRQLSKPVGAEASPCPLLGNRYSRWCGSAVTRSPAWVVSSPWQPVIDPLSEAVGARGH